MLFAGVRSNVSHSVFWAWLVAVRAMNMGTTIRAAIIISVMFLCTNCASTQPDIGLAYKDCWDGSTVPSDVSCPSVELESSIGLDGEKGHATDCGRTGSCVEVPVLFGTNRRVTFGRTVEVFDTFALVPDTPFETRSGDTLIYGTALATVPVKRKASGRIYRPRKISGRLIQKLDPSKHYVFWSYDQLTEDAFGEALQQADSAFVFVHGFNVSFENAILRAAQLREDGGFDGQALVFSWPTQHYDGGLPEREYKASRIEARKARVFFKEFMQTVRANGPRGKVHIIAHSMGNYMMKDVLRELNDERKQRVSQDCAVEQRANDGLDLNTVGVAGSTDVENCEFGGRDFGEIIFAAPDVERSEFVEMVESIDGLGRGLTLYASSKDIAMNISKRICELGDGPCDYRAGYVSDADNTLPTIAENLDTIDVSLVDRNVWNRFVNKGAGHSYFGADIQVIMDIRNVMATGARAEHRPFSLFPKERAGVKYWIMRGSN